MNYGEYHHSASSFDRENFEKIIRDSRRFPEVLWRARKNKITRSSSFPQFLKKSPSCSIKYEYREEEYYVKSKIRAVQSRNEFQNLSVIDEILLRFYGRFALVLNIVMRDNIREKTLYISDDKIKQIQYYTKMHIEYNGIHTSKDISSLDVEDVEDGLYDHDDFPAIALTNTINKLITEHRSEHIDTDYFYRISRAKRNRYMTQEEVAKLSLNTKNIIKLGNIVMDKAINSVGDDLQSILFRYSIQGDAATQNKKVIDLENEEEILYVIKNNEKLNYMDIAGFKLNKPEINVNGRFELDPNNELLKGQDEFSSGELIIPSHTPFRVVGIQKMDRTMNRRVVLLEPMKLEDINQTDIVQNNFNGEPFSSNGKFNLEEFTA